MIIFCHFCGIKRKEKKKHICVITEKFSIQVLNKVRFLLAKYWSTITQHEGWHELTGGLFDCSYRPSSSDWGLLSFCSTPEGGYWYKAPHWTVVISFYAFIWLVSSSSSLSLVEVVAVLIMFLNVKSFPQMQCIIRYCCAQYTKGKFAKRKLRNTNIKFNIFFLIQSFFLYFFMHHKIRT